jgi:ATP-dependent Clp protease ATP-binding subunit ClpX
MRGKGSAIGFGADVKDDSLQRTMGESFKQLEPEDLLKFGLIPEFVGRLPVVATLMDLDEDALVTILTEPKNALVKAVSKAVRHRRNGPDLYPRSACAQLPSGQSPAKTGARGLRSIMEDILLDTMFELPGMENVSEVVVNEEAVTSEAKPLIIYADAKKAAASAG